MIAVDKAGRGVIDDGGNVWMGKLKQACVKATATELTRTTQKYGQVLAMNLVLSDAQFEREHLQKRRFQLMAGRDHPHIMAWIDRIEILAR